MEVIKSILYVIGGGLILSFGAHYFVEAASRIAKTFGISSVVIGLTVVAFGTSSPEFAVNVLAAHRGNVDIAMGNVVGSNIFNVLGVLGLSGIVAGRGLNVNTHMQDIDIPVMVILSATCLPLAFFRQRFDRWIGPIFLLVYTIYTWHLITKTS